MGEKEVEGDVAIDEFEFPPGCGVEFLDPPEEGAVRVDEDFAVTFSAKRKCLVALFVDGRMRHTQEVLPDTPVSLALAIHHPPSLSQSSCGKVRFATLSIRLFLEEDQAGMSHSAAERRVRYTLPCEGAGHVLDGGSRGGGGEDGREGFPVCADPVVEASRGGEWADGFRGWFMPKACKLRRLGGDAARACLGNETVLFAGDSLIRHLFVAFSSLVAEQTDESDEMLLSDDVLESIREGRMQGVGEGTESGSDAGGGEGGGGGVRRRIRCQGKRTHRQWPRIGTCAHARCGT